MIYRPDTRTDKIHAMTDMMRWIYQYFGENPVGGQVLELLLLRGKADG